MPEQSRIIVGVLSGLKEHSRRNQCRKTWMSQLKQHNCPAFFLFGNSKQTAQKDDELHMCCPDDYISLPQKTRNFCQFCLDNYDFEYLFKCDDDTYVAVDRFLAYKPIGDYVGIDPVECFEDGQYSKGFNSGGAGYFLSHKAAQIVATHLTEKTGAEDLLVGRLLLSHGLKRTQDKRFQAWNLDRTIPTQHNNGITVHYVRGEQMQKIHEQFQ